MRHLIAEVSEEVNRKWAHGGTTFTPYTDPELSDSPSPKFPT